MAKKIDEMFILSHMGGVYGMVINETQKELIEKALRQSFGNKTIAAKILGINRNTLHYKIKKLNIDVRKYKI
ncbi:MAG: helix-turn-helix domain-containing protein [Candidatus Omnitrophota bacterium]